RTTSACRARARRSSCSTDRSAPHPRTRQIDPNAPFRVDLSRGRAGHRAGGGRIEAHRMKEARMGDGTIDVGLLTPVSAGRDGAVSDERVLAALVEAEVALVHAYAA